MNYLLKHKLKIVALFSLCLLIASCSDDSWLDLNFDDCSFYSYIEVATTCECLENSELNCSVDYLLDVNEYSRINGLFEAGQDECIEISGIDNSGEAFTGMA